MLTGVIQCTEKDEFAYQEMIAHLPLCGLTVRLHTAVKSPTSEASASETFQPTYGHCRTGSA